MSFKSKIFDKIFPLLNDKQCVDAHEIVINHINKLEKLIPSEYQQYKLIHIILAKAYGYNTEYDEIINIYFRLYYGFMRFLYNKQLAKNLAYMLLPYRVSWIKDNIRYYKEEKPSLVYSKCDNPLRNIDQNKSYNILFANFPSYFIPLIQYVNKSELDNHLIAIPRSMSENSIFDNIPPNRILILDEFITQSINAKYMIVKDEFNDIYKSNKDAIKKMFRIDNFIFFKFIDDGIEIIFKHLLPQSVFFCQILDEVFTKVNVNAVIGARVRRIYDRAFHISALNHGIRSYIMLHANIGDDIRWIPSMGHFNYLEGIFLWGESQKILVENDHLSNVNNLHVVGSPLFDSEHKNNNLSRKKHIILYAAGNNDKKEVKLLIEILQYLPDGTELLIKVHPSINQDYYQEFTSIDNVKVINYGITEDILDNIYPDILVTISSNSGYQSLVRGIPTVFLLFFNLNKWIKTFDWIYAMSNYQKNKFQIKNKSNLIDIINKLLLSEKYRYNFIAEQDEYIKTKMKVHKTTNGSTYEIDKILYLT